MSYPVAGSRLRPPAPFRSVTKVRILNFSFWSSPRVILDFSVQYKDKRTWGIILVALLTYIYSGPIAFMSFDF